MRGLAVINFVLRFKRVDLVCVTYVLANTEFIETTRADFIVMGFLFESKVFCLMILS